MKNSKDTEVTSAHYFGERGEEYFNWQNRFAERSGLINSRKFRELTNPSYRVLDFGCGGGYLLEALEANVKIGVEINPNAVKVAREKGIKVYESIEEIPSHSVDLIVSNHALEHVMYPVASLKELYRVMKIDSKIRICVPIDDWRRQRKFDPRDINNHLYTWTPQLMGNCLVEAGFLPEDISISIFSHSWFPGTKYLWKQEKIFDLLCSIYATLRRNGRQIIVTAIKS